MAASLRGVVAGSSVAEYALHFLRIGVTTFLSVGEASDEYKDCVRSYEVDAKAVYEMLAGADAQPALQSGQRTVWDING